MAMSSITWGKLQMSLAENIRRYRNEKGWSQKELADRCGISHPRISELETGKSNPTLLTIHTVARQLGVSIDDLITSKIHA